MRNPFEDMFRDFFGERYDNRERQAPQRRGSGSGVIMTKDGYIITNNHVVENASEVEVLLNDNRTYKAEIEGTDDSAIVEQFYPVNIVFGSPLNLKVTVAEDIPIMESVLKSVVEVDKEMDIN